MSRPSVLFGGPSPEHDVSILTGLQATRALESAGHAVAPIYWSKSGEFFSVDPTLEAAEFLAGVPRKATRLELVAGPGGGFLPEGGRFGKRVALDVTAVVNCCHGGPGEDGSLQAALELAGVRYTGPSPAGAALGMDKLAFAAVVAAAGLPCLPHQVLTAGGPAPDFDGPYIVKPRFGGSSIGIEITDDIEVARALARSSPHLRDGAVVEPYHPDAIDLNVSVRTYPRVAISSVERPLRTGPSGKIYTYADKYLGGEGLSSAPRELPAAISDDLRQRIVDIAGALVEVALVRSVARIDFLADGDDLFVNEINTIPGSLARYFWSHEGVTLPALLADLIAEAVSGPTRRYSTEGADGAALRAAGSIASKLA